MSNFTQINVYDHATHAGEGNKLVINCQVRALNPTEYEELFDAIRAVQKITDKYLYGAPVTRADERDDVPVTAMELEDELEASDGSHPANDNTKSQHN